MESKLPPIVLGAQLAAARAAEAERLAKGNAKASPIGPRMRYDFWSGQLDLTDPTELPLDEQLAGVCHRYAASDAETRAAMRAAASMDDFYTLMSFVSRMSVFAVRQRKPQRVIDGMMAIAMIELRRTDPRDVMSALGLIYAAAAAIGDDAELRLRTMAELAESPIADLAPTFLSRPGTHKEFSTWGYVPVEAARGLGLVRTEYRPYRPTCPLHRVVMDIARIVNNRKYQTEGVSIASELPPIWLSRVDDQALRSAMQQIVAGATVHGKLRPETFTDHQYQMLVAFLVEVANESAAETLHRLATAKATSRSDIALLGVRRGRLFCLVVGRCFMEGKVAFENQQTIQRFAGGIQGILDGYQ